MRQLVTHVGGVGEEMVLWIEDKVDHTQRPAAVPNMQARARVTEVTLKGL